MNEQNFSTRFVVDQSPEAVFAAINDVRAWWSGEIAGPTAGLGAEFTYSYKTLHKTTQQITEFVPGKRVVWHVTASHLGFVADANEWTGTDVVFEITSQGAKTDVCFTHVGLVPAFECYGDCSGAWSFYINESLRRLIETGKGEPNEPATKPLPAPEAALAVG